MEMTAVILEASTNAFIILSDIKGFANWLIICMKAEKGNVDMKFVDKI